MLPSIRTLAKQENCNPATVRRSLEALLQDGLITCKGTFGFQVKNDSAFIENERIKESHMAQNQLISGLTALGLSKQDILSLINKCCVECIK
ncbi:MAG: GntR family transcriptional regulator [Oscillospiraceae bacterium]|nr:GntR family transcriptional regulator [Oscillospiraceae bacterium]